MLLDGHAQMRSKRRQVFVVSSTIASSTGKRLSLATSSATRAASHGPDDSEANSPPYFQGASHSTSSDSIGTCATSSRSRSR